MKGRIIGMVVPASVAGAVLGASAVGQKAGWISAGVWYWLWPSLVALVYLALGVGALVIRARKWSIPPFAGFLVQVLGILFLIPRWLVRRPLEVLWYSLGAFAIALVVVLVVWMIVALRTRALEKKLVEGAGTDGVDQQSLQTIRKNMGDALALLRKAGQGRNAIYELPWFLVMGRPQGGKTFAIKKSGLSLPVRQDWVKGVGGTFTADWFFTNEMIFLDTPGKWVVEGVGEDGSRTWTELLRLLRRNRGRRPLDGLVVVVPADDLLSKTREELFEQASNIREVIDLIHDELKFRFPVYLVVSKSDLVEGFVDFFKGLPANRKHQVFGWSHPDPNDRDAVKSIRKAFGRVLRRMQAVRLEILARTASISTNRRLFLFTEEFRRLEDPLVEFADALFQSDPYHETPVFRGFYFTSATQGEGAPLGQAMAQLARNLGVRTLPAAAGEEEPKRSYFLLELFREVLVGDEGLVSRTAGHWLRRRRDTVLAAFLPAAIATFFLLLSLISFAWNRSIYHDAAEEIPKIVADLRSRSDVSQDAYEALKRIDRIREYDEDMTGFTLFRGFGMRQPGDLEWQTFRIFRDELMERVLKPTFAAAQRIALDPSTSPAEKIDALYAIVWLRQGNRTENRDDLRGFERIWSNLDQRDQDKARELLVEQVEYLLLRKPDESLLDGVNLEGMAETIHKGFAQAGAASSLQAYFVFQQACANAAGPNQIRQCNLDLKRAIAFKKGDLARLRANLTRLKTDLEAISGPEQGAKAALEQIRGINLADTETGAAYEKFDTDVVPSLEDYYVKRQKEFIEACEEQVASQGGARVAAVDAIEAQEKELEAQQQAITQRMREFSQTYPTIVERFGQFQPSVVFVLSKNYRRVECLDEREAAVPPPPPVAAGVPSAPRPSAPRGAAAPVARSGFTYFSPTVGAPSGYSLDAWTRRKVQWLDQAEYAKRLQGGERARVESQIRADVETYAAAYETAWKQYLRGIRLREASAGAVGSWLQGLSSSGEWRKVLDPAATAMGAVNDATDPALSSFAQRLRGMAAVTSFPDVKLGEYLALLARVSEDIRKCDQSTGYLGQYRSQVQANDASNSLVAAIRWAELNAGEAVAEGSLLSLFKEPLETARRYLGSSDLGGRRWSDLVSLSQRVADKFPFGGASAVDPVSLDDLRALFGGQSGGVPVLYKDRDTFGLGPEARAWLERAQALSEVLYDPGKDELKPYALRVSIAPGDVVITPDKAAEAKEFRLETFRFTAGGSDFIWKASEPDQQTQKVLPVTLFGDEAGGVARISAAVGKRKGMFGRMGKNDWEALPVVAAASAEGDWATLRALSQLKDRRTVDANTVKFTVAVPFEFKKSEPGNLTIDLTATAKGLPKLLELLQKPLGPAPQP